MYKKLEAAIASMNGTPGSMTCKARKPVNAPGMVPRAGKTAWSDYARTHSYGEADFEAKCAFVRKAAGSGRWRRVWDLGCNTGTFSRIAAEHADYVIAMDGDWMAVEPVPMTPTRWPVKSTRSCGQWPVW